MNIKNAWSTLVAFIRSVPRADWWAVALVMSVSALLCSVIYKVHMLQTRPDPRLKEFMGDYVSASSEPGRRGSIFDRRGRLIASTHFGKFLVIDPVEFPGRRWTTDEAIPALAEALGENPTVVGQAIMKSVRTNERVWTAAGVDLTSNKPRPSVKGLDRYEHIGPLVLSDRQLEAITGLMNDKKKRMAGMFMMHRPVRDRVADELVAPMVGLVGMHDTTGEDEGKYGIERRVDKKGIDAEDGKLQYVRDAAGHPLWVPPDGYTAPKRGEDVVLSVDLELQKIVSEELARGAEDVDAAGARCVLVDVQTGDIVAMLDIVRDVKVKDYDFKTFIPKPSAEVKTSGTRYRVIKAADPMRNTPETRRNRCVEDIYEPGSTFKPFMWSTVLDLGRAGLKEVFSTENPWKTPEPDKRWLRDVTRRPTQTMEEILVNSSNIGMVKLTTRLEFDEMHSAVTRFGFGRRTGIEIAGESPGGVTPLSKWTRATHVSNAIGHEVSVTPVQMVRAFSAFCREGELAGTVTDVRLISSIGDKPGSQRTERRVLSPKAALTTRETMRGVTHKIDEALREKTGETDWKYELFGKSGTAQIPISDRDGRTLPKGSSGYYTGQYFSSFIAGGPVVNPRLAIIVIMDDPSPTVVLENRYYGSKVAGPVARRVMERALAYLGVPASPPPSEPTKAHGGD